MEALLARRGALAAKKADLERRVRELGSLPADAFERYRGQALPALHALLAKAQAQLKKFQCAPALGPARSSIWDLGCSELTCGGPYASATLLVARQCSRLSRGFGIACPGVFYFGVSSAFACHRPECVRNSKSWPCSQACQAQGTGPVV